MAKGEFPAFLKKGKWKDKDKGDGGFSAADQSKALRGKGDKKKGPPAFFKKGKS